MFENWNQRFPPLAKQVAPLSLYQNIVPTKCLQNQLGMVRSLTIGRSNWCSLTSASPPRTKIFDRRKTFIDLASFRLFLHEDYTPYSQMAGTREKLVPRHESEALEDKQKLQMKTSSELAECLAQIPLQITLYGLRFKYN